MQRPKVTVGRRNRSKYARDCARAWEAELSEHFMLRQPKPATNRIPGRSPGPQPIRTGKRRAREIGSGRIEARSSKTATHRKAEHPELESARETTHHIPSWRRQELEETSERAGFAVGKQDQLTVCIASSNPQRDHQHTEVDWCA
jgi:hypothetical protein